MLEDRFHWKQILSLGEELLNQADSSAQCRLLEQTVANSMNARIRVWLAGSSYPLPGESPSQYILNDNHPPVALFAWKHRRISCLVENNPEPSIYSDRIDPVCIAFPLRTQDDCLGILLAEKENGGLLIEDEIQYLEIVTAHAALALQVSRHAAIKKWRNEQIKLVQSVSAQINQILDLHELFIKATRLIQESYGYYNVSLFTLDEGNHRLNLQSYASSHTDVRLPQDFSVEFGSGIVGMVAQTGNELVVQDTGVNRHYRLEKTLPNTQSEAALPLKIEDKLLGVLDIQSIQPCAFHETDIVVMRSLADNLAMAIEEAHVYSDLERHAGQISAILEVSHKLNSILNLDKLLQEIVQIIHKRFGYPFVQIFTVHSNRRLVIYETSSEKRQFEPGEHILAYSLDDPVGIVPWVARNNRPRLANNVDADPLYRQLELLFSGTKSELAIPLSYAGDVVGVLDVQSDTGSPFTQNDIDLLDGLAAGIAIAIRNATVYKEEQWQRQVANSLNDVAGLISANTALETLLDTILFELERNLPCEIAAIWLLDENSSDPDLGIHPLKLAAIHGADAGLVTRTVRQNPSIRKWLDDILNFSEPGIRRNSEIYGPLGTSMDYPKDYSAIAFPLKSGNLKLGVIEIAHSSANLYGSDAGSLVSTFAGYAAVAIHNARLFSDAQEQAWISNVLLQVAGASRNAGTTEDLFLTMVRIIPLLIGINRCAIFLWNEQQEVFEFKAAHGFEDQHFPQFLSEKDYPAFSRLKNKSDAIIADPSGDLHFEDRFVRTEDETFMLLPLLVQGSLVGAFLVAHHVTGQPGAQVILTDRTVSILQSIAHQIAVSYENLRLTEYSQQESYVAAVMLQVAQAISTQSSLEETLDSILNLMPILVGVNSCAIYRWDPQTCIYTPLQAYSDLKNQTETILQNPVAGGESRLLDQTFELNRPHFCPVSISEGSLIHWNNQDCPPAEEIIYQQAEPTNSWLMAFPLSSQGQKFGVLVTKEVNAPANYRSRRIEIITGIAQQIALAIENDTLKIRMLERERIENEFKLARQIQLTFLPEKMPDIPGWDFNSHWQTAREVGGDFYDVFQLDGCHLGLVVADVSDKGMPAALYMTVTRMLIRAYAKTHLSPASVLEKVNEILQSDTQGGMFVTATYAILCTEDGTLSYSNAGHNRPILLRVQGDRLQVLPKGELAIGILDNVRYKDYQFKLEPDEYLLMYTDGVTDTFSKSGVAFGEERLLETLTGLNSANSQQLLDTLEQVLMNFRENTPLSDDLTILCAHRNPRRLNDRRYSLERSTP